MAPKGQDLREHLVQKYGPGAAASVDDPNSHLKVMGRAVGIQFNNDRRMVNTIQAHALVEAVKEQHSNDKANQLMDALYQQYFCEARDISDPDVLAEIAQSSIMLSPQETKGILASAARQEDVRSKDQHVKHDLGVSGVPFFIVEPKSKTDRPVAFSGAVPVSFLAKKLQEATNM